MIRNKNIQDIISRGYDELSIVDKRIAYSLFQKERDTLGVDIYHKLKKYIFKMEPPTPEEFLDPRNGWLPKKVIDEIWPHVKEDFLDILYNNKKYFQIVQYGATRLGKSFLARLLVIYTIVFIHCLREPALFYGLSSNTPLGIYFLSFKFDKTRQLYLQHIYKYLESSERFKKLKYKDKVKEEQYRIGNDIITYSEPALVGEITLASDLQIILGNDDPNEVIGADILQTYISEINFFIEKAGATEDKIYQLYTDIYDRIEATTGQDFLTYVYLDSSANYEDSLIERNIINKIQYEENTFFRWRSRWEARPNKFPKWRRTGETFKVITGNGDTPAKIVDNEADLEGVPKDLVDEVPIDAKKNYEKNLLQSIKNIGGKPTSNESKFIQNRSTIDNIWFTTLFNIEGGIVAEAEKDPKNLIWDKVEGIFFNKVNDKHILYRAPSEPRVIALDTAFSTKGDIYGLGMGHLEWSERAKKKIVVMDFCFPLFPGKEGINLTAVKDFIIDLKTKGGVNIHLVVSDSFQSQQMLQDLERAKIDTKKQSVDKELEPYQRTLTAMIGKAVKVGRNIFLKNNLGCLERKRDKKDKEKIDHSKGSTNNKYNGDWVNSVCGINGKDCSDVFANTVFTLFESTLHPSVVFETENKKFSTNKIDQKEMIDIAFKKLCRSVSLSNITNK